MNAPLFLIAIGIAADNFIIAALSGGGFALTRNHKWVLILLLMFIIQNQVLWYGEWFGTLTKNNWMNGVTQWMGIGIMLAIGLRMIQELKTSNESFRKFHFDTMNVLMLGFGTSLYVFAFGCAADWLDISDREINLSLLPLIALFLIGGLLLGKFHCNRILKMLHTAGVTFTFAGALIMLIQIVEQKTIR